MDKIHDRRFFLRNIVFSGYGFLFYKLSILFDTPLLLNTSKNKINTYIFHRDKEKIMNFNPADFFDLKAINSWKIKIKARSYKNTLNQHIIKYSVKCHSSIDRDVLGYLILKKQFQNVNALKSDNYFVYTNAFSFFHEEKRILSKMAEYGIV